MTTTAPILALYDCMDAGTLRSMVGVGPDLADYTKVAFYASGKKITDAEAKTRMATTPLLFWSSEWFNVASPFGPEYLAWFYAKVAEAMQRIGQPDVFHVSDFENESVVKVAWHKVMHLQAASNFLSDAISDATFGRIVRGANYNSTSLASIDKLGGGANWRMGTYTGAGLFNGFTLLSTYDKPGPCTDAEFDHALEMAPRPFGVVIRSDDPQCAARVKQVRLAGAELILIYGGIANGKAKVIPARLAMEIAGTVVTVPPSRVRATRVKGNG